MERTSICVACAHYGTAPLSLAVDPACQSPDEADALCSLHRARATEGYCVLCARREPWVSPWPGSTIGCCRPCFSEVYGTESADRAQTPSAPLRRSRATWARQGGRRGC